MRVLLPWKKSPSHESDSEHSLDDNDNYENENDDDIVLETESSLPHRNKTRTDDDEGETVQFHSTAASCIPAVTGIKPPVETENQIRTDSKRIRNQESKEEAPATLDHQSSDTLLLKATATSTSVTEFDSSTPAPASSLKNGKKRPRPTNTADSKPPAKPSSSIPAMAGGRRIRRPRPEEDNDSPDRHRRNDPVWEEEQDPLENEAPRFHTNKPSTIAIVATPAAAEEIVLEDQKPPSDLAFEQALKKRGLEIVEQEGDGSCLFRAVSLQVYGDPSMHDQVRERCLDFMERDPEHFSPFIALGEGETFADYIARKRRPGVHGNDPEIQAISELYNRPVEVFTPERGATPLNIFQSAYKTADVPIRLSYHNGSHYNAVIDPLMPTAGLGLGLPGLQPGLADKMQMAKAVVESDHLADEMELEQALQASEQDALKMALRESTSLMEKVYGTALLPDVDATNFELEQKVLANSLESYRRQEHGRKQRASPTLRGRQPSPVFPDFVADPATSVAAAAPSVSDSSLSSSFSPGVASIAVASAVSSSAAASIPYASAEPILGPADEYPETVQELVMNGFELRKVVHAYELIGDNFDDLLAFLISNSSS